VPGKSSGYSYLKTGICRWEGSPAKVPYFRIYDLRSTYATHLSAGGVADERVTQLLRQGDAKVLKKYSQMKLQMKREALQKLNRKANEAQSSFDTEKVN
jgi:integrase